MAMRNRLYSRLRTDIDAPASEDRLGRKAFASRLAQLVTNWKGSRSLVIGLYGEWGAGKTTVKNFALQSFQLLPVAEQPIVIHFNPWEWDERALRMAFFNEIAKELRAGDASAADAGQRLTNYAGVLSVTSSIASSAEVLVSLLSPAFVPVIAAAKQVFERSATVVEKAGELTDHSEKPLSKLKEQVTDALRCLDRNVLVVVDDVDRLTSAETGQLFQLLKANGDFPRMVYLILCDRAVVERALDDLVTDHGRDFLEKIVNVGFDLPRASDEAIEETLTAGVEEILDQHDLRSHFDRLRWADAFDEALVDIFTTLRDVNRYLATIEFTISDLARNFRNDFDIGDFLVVEVLRVFFPDVYQRLGEQKLRMTGKVRFPKGVVPDEAMRDPKLTRAKLLNFVAGGDSGDDVRTVKALLIDLFPSFRDGSWVFGSSHARVSPISQSSAFDRYFFFSIPPRDISAERRSVILAARSDYSMMLKILRQAKNDRRLSDVVDVLCSREGQVSYDTAAFVSAVVDFFEESDEYLPVGRYSLLSEILRLSYDALKALGQQRSNVYLDVFERTKGVTLLFDLLPDRQQDDGEPLVGEETVRAAESILLRKLQHLGEMVLDHLHGRRILLNWHRRFGSEEPIQISRAAAKDPCKALKLLRLFVARQPIEIGRPRLRHGDLVLLDSLDELVSLTELLEVASLVDPEARTPYDHYSLELLCEVIKNPRVPFPPELAADDLRSDD